MKRILKIILYFFGSLLLIVALILIFSNAIISYSLKVLVENRSEGKVELKVEDFDFDLINGSVLILRPELQMHGIYLNESKSISLDKVVFSSISIDLLDLRQLIMKRNIDAEKFIIDKPEFWFTEQGTNSQSSFHPDKLFEALNHNPGLFKMLKVRIGDIEIHYGSINIKEFSGSDVDPGLFDFTILLHDFNSEKKSDSLQTRILFSEELKFKLKDLQRTLKSGYTIKMDSATFSSKKRDLEIAGAAFIPSKENIEEGAVEVYAGSLALTDIELEEVRGLQDLNLQAIHISDGYFTTYLNGKDDENETDTTRNLKSLKKLFYDFMLDSISINRFSYFNVDGVYDTSIAASNIYFLISGIRVDSAMLDDPFRKFLYDSIKLGTGEVDVQKFIPGLNLNYQNLFYTNKDRNLVISGLKIKNDSSERIPDKIDLIVSELDVQGFSLKRFQAKQTQRLSVTIYEPDLNLDLAHPVHDKHLPGRKFRFPEHLVLENVILQNGIVSLSRQDELEIDLKGLNLSVEDFNFPDKSDTSFRYQNLVFNYQNLDGYLSKNHLSFRTGLVSFKGDNLQMNNAGGNYYNPESGKVTAVGLKSLDLTGFDLYSLLWKMELKVENIKLTEPDVTGEIVLIPAKKEQKSTINSSGIWSSPFKASIGGIQIEDGGIKASACLKSETLEMSSGYNARIGDVKVDKGDSLSILLKQLLWEADLQNTRFVVKEHEVTFDLLETNSFKSDFKLKNLSVKSLLNKNSLKNSLTIRSLFTPLLEVSGLNYQLLICEDSVSLQNINLSDVSFDVVLPKKEAVSKDDPGQKLDLKKFLVLNYDTLAFKILSGNLVQAGDSSFKKFSLRDFNFRHVTTNRREPNLLNNLNLGFRKFDFKDTISGMMLSINGGILDKSKNQFEVESVEWLNRHVNHQASENFNKPLLDVKSSNIQLKNLFLKNELPSDVQIGEIYIDEFDLLQKKEKEKKDKIRTKADFDFIDKYSNLITELRVDSTVFNDLSVSLETINDTNSTYFVADSLALIVHKIELDTIRKGEGETFLFEKITVDPRNRIDITNDSLYEIRTGRFYFNSLENALAIDSVYLSPRYDDSVFFKKSIYQTDRIDLFGRKIVFNNIDFHNLLDNDLYKVSSVDFMDFNVTLFRNKNYPFRPGIYKPLPREALMSVDQKFEIDTVRFTNAYLNYIQLDSNAIRPGEIFLSEFNLSAFNITNNFDPEDHESRIKVDLNAKILGETKMNFTLFFPLAKGATAFWLSGKTEDIDMVKLNQVTKNLMGIGITDGIGSVEVPLISGNDSVALGSLYFRYKKLRLALYNRKKEELNSSFFSPVVNFFINDLVLRSNNPRFARRTKTGIVYFRRDTRKSVVNYTFKSILSGMLYTLGLNSKGQRQEKKDLKKK